MTSLLGFIINTSRSALKIIEKKTGWAYSSCRKSASLFWFDHDAYIIMNKDFKKIYKEIEKIVGDV